jgi:hypothetical protein
LDPSSCDPALLRNPSLSKPKQVQSRSRQTRLALSNWAKPQGSVRRPLPSHAPASRGARQATRKGKFPEGGPISIRQPLKRRREARWHLPRNRTTGALAQSSVIRTATTNKSPQHAEPACADESDAQVAAPPMAPGLVPILTASRSAARHTARARFIRCRRVFPGQR